MSKRDDVLHVAAQLLAHDRRNMPINLCVHTAAALVAAVDDWYAAQPKPTAPRPLPTPGKEAE